MAAAAGVAALAQALQDASIAATSLAAGGGVTVAQVQAAVQQALVQPLQQSLEQTTAALTALQQQQAQTTAALTALQQAQTQTTAALTTLQQQQAQTTAQTTAALAALQAAVLRVEITAAKAYHGGARDGAVRAFLQVPNAAGLLAPAGPAGAPLAPLRSFADLHALSGAQLNAGCAHYGVAAPQALAQRRLNVALALGANPLAGELGA